MRMSSGGRSRATSTPPWPRAPRNRGSSCWWSAPTFLPPLRDGPGSAPLLSAPDPARTVLSQQSWRAPATQAHPSFAPQQRSRTETMVPGEMGNPSKALKTPQSRSSTYPFAAMNNSNAKFVRERRPCNGTNASVQTSRTAGAQIYANHCVREHCRPITTACVRTLQQSLSQLIRGELINDRRLKKALAIQFPRVAVITPYYKEPWPGSCANVTSACWPRANLACTYWWPTDTRAGGSTTWQCRSMCSYSPQPWRHRIHTTLDRELSRHRPGGGCRGLPRCRQLVRTRPHCQSSGGNGPRTSGLRLIQPNLCRLTER